MHIKLTNLRKSKGFTVVELIIYMGLLSGLILLFTEIFVSITESELQSENTSNVSSDGRYIYSRIIYDVNRADDIVTPTNYGDTTNQLIISVNGEDYTYSLSSNNLILTNLSGQYQL